MQCHSMDTVNCNTKKKILSIPYEFQFLLANRMTSSKNMEISIWPEKKTIPLKVETLWPSFDDVKKI